MLLLRACQLPKAQFLSKNKTKANLTFHLVGRSSTDLCLAVFQQVLERRHQIVLGDLWANSLLQLYTNKNNER